MELPCCWQSSSEDSSAKMLSKDAFFDKVTLSVKSFKDFEIIVSDSAIEAAVAETAF